MWTRRETEESLVLKWEEEPWTKRFRPRFRLPSGRRLLRWAAVLTVLSGLPVVLVLGLRLVSQLQAVDADLKTASTELLDGVKILQADGSTIKPAAAAQAARDFADARLRFNRSHAYLAQSRVLGVLGALPPVGRQLRAAQELTDIGDRLARSGSLGVQVVDTLLAEQAIGPNSKKAPSERVLAVLTALHARLPAIQSELAAVGRDRAAIPSSGLLPQLKTAVVRLDGKFAEVNQLVTSVASLEPGIAELLGATGTRTYLVLQQDPAELRATGGFIGSVGFLSFDHGRMAPYRAQDIYTIDRGTTRIGDAGYVAPPAPIDSRIHPSSWELRDANWSPDFPTAAHQAESFYQGETGRQVDGVIAIDPYFMAKLLALVGPVTVPETGDTLTPENFFAKTLFKVEGQVGPGRKDFLSQAARPIFERLTTLPSAQWVPMLQTLATSCQGRTLQAYFNRAAAEGVVQHFACGGELRSGTADGLMVVDSNLDGNKDDFWLKRSFTLQIAGQPNGTIDHTLTIHYDGSGLAPNPLTGLYIDWIRVYLPAGSQLEASRGATLSQSTEAGRAVVAGWMRLSYRQSVDVVIRYRTPGLKPGGDPKRLALLWQKQAGRTADPITIHVQPPPGLPVTGVGVNGKPAGSQATIKSDLSVDRFFEVTYR